MHISVPRYALAFAIDKTRLISSADVVGQVDKVRLEDAQGQPYTARVIARQEHLALLELDAGQGQFSSYLNLAENFSGGTVTCVRAAGTRFRSAAGVSYGPGHRAAAPDAMGGEPGGSSASCRLSAVRCAGAGGGRRDRQTRRMQRLACPQSQWRSSAISSPRNRLYPRCRAHGRTR